MTGRRVSRAQERLWSEDTVVLGQAPEPNDPQPSRAALHISRRGAARALAGGALAGALALGSVLALGGSSDRPPQPSAAVRVRPEVAAAEARPPSIASSQALAHVGRPRRRSDRRSGRAGKKRRRPEAAEPMRDRLTAPAPVAVEAVPEVEPPPAPAPPGPPSPPAPATSPTIEFGIEHH